MDSNDDDFVVIRSFPHATAAHLAAGLLDSAGIEVKFADEYTANLYPAGAVVGGVKLLVRQSEVADAEAALSDIVLDDRGASGTERGGGPRD